LAEAVIIGVRQKVECKVWQRAVLKQV